MKCHSLVAGCLSCAEAFCIVISVYLNYQFVKELWDHIVPLAHIMGVLLLLLVVHQLVPALGLDLCSAITYSGTFICTPINLPSGVAAKTCKDKITGIKYICGATVTYSKKSLCPFKARQIASRANNICLCSIELVLKVKQAPGLIRKGVTDAADIFTGITSPILSGAAETTACMINAGLAVRNTNKKRLLAQLTSEASDIILAGTNAYNIHMWPAITLADYIDVTARLLWCANDLSAVLFKPEDVLKANTHFSNTTVDTEVVTSAVMNSSSSDKPPSHTLHPRGLPATDTTADALAATAATPAAAIGAETVVHKPPPIPAATSNTAAPTAQQPTGQRTQGVDWEATVAMAAAALARHYSSSNARRRDRGTALLFNATTPDGVLVQTQTAEAILRAAGAPVSPMQAPQLPLSAFPGCQSLVDLVAVKADAALRQGLLMVLQILHPYFYYISAVLTEMDTFLQGLSDLTSPRAWQAYVDAAANVAATKGCSDLQTCYGGLLADIYREMTQIPLALDNTHYTVTSMINIITFVQQAATEVADLLCDGTKKLTDASFRKISFFDLLVHFMWSDDTSSKLFDPSQHLHILAEMMYKFNSMHYAEAIARQQQSLFEVLNWVQADIDSVVASADERLAMALNKLVKLVELLTDYVPGTPPACADGSTPAPCSLEACSGVTCFVGQCQADACSGCTPGCTQTPRVAPTLLDAQQALSIAKEWLALLGQQQTIVNGGRTVADRFLPLLNSARFFFGSISTNLDSFSMSSIAKFGILTYQRAGSVALDVPCVTGKGEAKFSIAGFTVKASYPKVSTCSAGATFPMPNEHIPWIRVHRGLSALPQQALNVLKPGAVIPPFDERACFSE